MQRWWGYRRMFPLEEIRRRRIESLSVMEKRLVETWSRDVPLSSLAATAGITRHHVYSLLKKIRRAEVESFLE